MIGSSRRGFSINIFCHDGTADGLRIVEKSNWTGRAVVCPRPRFAETKGRQEFNRTGVYVLIGPRGQGHLPTLYVGEGDPAKPRLEDHLAKKDFWTQLILFTSKDENLNKAHVQYLESRLVALAKEAKRCELENGNVPQLRSLSEPDVAEMEEFLAQMLLIYPLLGVDAFSRPQRQERNVTTLYLKGRGIEAKGFEADEGFVVLAGSHAAKEAAPSTQQYVVQLRQSLLQQELLVSKGDSYSLTQDYTFDSPSTAAAAMLGRSANGRTEWKDAHGKTLKEIQTAALEQ